MVLLLITISFFVIFYFKNKMAIGNIKEKGYILHKEFLDSQYCDRIMMSVNTEMFNKNREEFFVEHLHGFSNLSLKKLFNKTKFKLELIKNIKEPSGKYTTYCFLTK